MSERILKAFDDFATLASEGLLDWAVIETNLGPALDESIYSNNNRERIRIHGEKDSRLFISLEAPGFDGEFDSIAFIYFIKTPDSEEVKTGLSVKALDDNLNNGNIITFSYSSDRNGGRNFAGSVGFAWETDRRPHFESLGVRTVSDLPEKINPIDYVGRFIDLALEQAELVERGEAPESFLNSFSEQFPDLLNPPTQPTPVTQ